MTHASCMSDFWGVTRLSIKWDRELMEENNSEITIDNTGDGVIWIALDKSAPIPVDVVLENQQRAAVLKSLSGILPSTITDDEVKACRATK